MTGISPNFIWRYLVSWKQITRVRKEIIAGFISYFDFRFSSFWRKTKKTAALSLLMKNERWNEPGIYGLLRMYELYILENLWGSPQIFLLKVRKSRKLFLLASILQKPRKWIISKKITAFYYVKHPPISILICINLF